MATRKTINGREICLANDAGRAEYTRRKQLLWEWQGGLCKVCEKRMWMLDARMTGGAWKETEQERNDRLKDKDGNQVNFLVHKACLATWHRQTDRGGLPPLAALAVLLFLIFCFPIKVKAQASNAATVSGQAITPFGGPAAGAIVRICPVTATIVSGACTPTSTIYSDSNLTQQIANPTTADANGNWSVFTSNTPLGLYIVQVQVQPGTTYTYYWGAQPNSGGAVGPGEVPEIPYYSSDSDIQGDPYLVDNAANTGGTGSLEYAGNGAGFATSAAGDYSFATLGGAFSAAVGNGITLADSSTTGISLATAGDITNASADFDVSATGAVDISGASAMDLSAGGPLYLAGSSIELVGAGSGACSNGLALDGSGNLVTQPCNPSAPNSYLTTTLSGNVGSTDTTIPLTSVSGLTPTGEIVIGTEWISYTGISGNNLTGATRGVHLTTPAAYSSGTGVYSVIVDFTNPAQPITAGSYMVPNYAEVPLTVFGCGSPDQGNQVFMQFGCPGTAVEIGDGGGIQQENSNTVNNFYAPTEIGSYVAAGFANIVSSGNLFDSTRQNNSTVAQGFGAGIAPVVEAVQPPTIGAPNVINFAQPSGGSTPWSYECTGTDVDGNTYPGAVTTVEGPATITGGEMIVTCPYSAGATSETIWRTAGGPVSPTLVDSGPQPWSSEDVGVDGIPGAPPSTNSSVPKQCVGGSEVSCWISSASAPTGSCTNGWFDTNQSGSPATLYQCVGNAWTAAGASGVSSVNSGTGAITIAAGSNMVVTTTGSTVTLATSGSAGSGTVGSGTQYQDVTYPNSGSNATVGALTNKYTVPTGLNTSQLNTVFSGLSNSTVAIQNGDGTTPFTNSNFNGVQDLRETYPVTDWNVKESGAQCDLQYGYATLTASSTTLTVSDYSLSAADVGKNIEVVGYDTATSLPSRFDPTITAVTNGTTATLSTAAPFSVTGFSMAIGHRDDAAIAAAFAQFTYHRPIAFPTGNCWSDTIYVYGQSFHGNGRNASFVSGLAGDDVFATYDTTNPDYQGMSADAQIHDMQWVIDPRINASQPWEDVNSSGTVTAHAATNRPTGLWTVWANYPLGPGWIVGTGPNNTGAINGVASTNGTTGITVTSSTVPIAGQQIVFPYASTGVFVTTVSAVSGSAVTLAAAYPVSGSQTQQEWMAGAAPGSVTSGTAVQEIETAISATGRTFPMTITLANPITPPLTPNGAGTGSNVAPYGLVQIGSEQFSYFGDSAYPATANSTPTITLTAGAQNGTSAAPHSIGAAIVPLNPFQPTWPWPVTPSINSGVTPANAVYFPAWNIGNAGWSQPISDGTHWAGAPGLSFANMHDISITIATYPGGGNPSENPIAFQEQNATAGMYIVAAPFKSRFTDIHIIDPQFGIFEGTPSTNVYGMFGSAYPTANGNTWQNITIQSAGYDTLFVYGQNDSKKDFLTFCQNGGETGNSQPGLTPAYLGCGAAWIWGGTYDDQAGGGGSDNNWATHDNWYIEEEAGAQAEMQPSYEFNCGYCTYGNAAGGGPIFVEGANNNFRDASIVAGPNTPLINYGSSTTMSHIAGLGSSGVLSNVYGIGTVLNYGPNAAMMGNVASQDFGPYGNLAQGTITTVDGQTGDSFATGNDAAPYASPSSAMIYPYEFGDYTYDSTAPISLSHHLCSISPGNGCYQTAFINSSHIGIGSGQRLGLGKYVAHFAVKTPAAANSLTFNLYAVDSGNGACASGAGPTNIYTQTVTTANTAWSAPIVTAPISFAANSGCVLGVEWTNGATSDTMQVAYLVFSPVWTNPVTENLDVLNNLFLSSLAADSGDCLQLATGGQVVPTGTPCGSSGGGLTALTQDVLVSGSGSQAATVVGINDTLLSGLATGLLKNTTGTGVPSIATAADVISLWTGTCSSTTYLRGDGSCETPAGAGGTPGGTDGQIQYNNSGNFGGISTTGTGDVVLATSPTLVTPILGAAIATSIQLNGGTTWTGSSSANSQVVTCPTGGTGTEVCDASGAWVAGSPTFETSGSSNSSQTLLNFITSTVNADGLTITPSNPSGGQEKLELTGTLNATGFPSLTGDVTNSGLATTVGKLENITLPTLATETGILYDTAGVLSLSTSASILTSGTLPSGRFGPLTGDVTTSGYAATLATVNSGPGSCGSATAVCVITTNGKGLVTAQSSTDITGLLSGLTSGDFLVATGTTSAGNSDLSFSGAALIWNPGSGSTIFGSGTASNTDGIGELSFSSSTSETYSWVNTYTSHPECVVQPQFEVPGDLTTPNPYWVTYTGTTSFTINFGAAVTGSVSYLCNARN